MATNMDLVSIATTFLVLYLSSLNTGNAGIIRRDVPPIAIPINLEKPVHDNSTQNNSTKGNETEADIAKAKNCSIEVVAFIPFTENTNANETEITNAIHESYPNPPAPTPPSPTVITTTKAAEVTSKAEVNNDGTKKWGFDDKYLASQNKYATRRNVVFDVVAGDAMSFSNYNVLGHQEVSLQRKK